MRLIRGESEFEISIRPEEGEWEGCVIEYHISRLTPTVHLRHCWTSLDAALAGIQRRWRRLFPDQELPDFRAAILPSLPPDD